MGRCTGRSSLGRGSSSSPAIDTADLKARLSIVTDTLEGLKAKLQNVRPCDEEAQSSKDALETPKREATVKGGGPGTPEIDREMGRGPATDCSSDDAGAAILPVARVDAVAAQIIQGLHVPAVQASGQPSLPKPRAGHRQRKKRPVHAPFE